MRIFVFIAIGLILSGCWPTSVSFVDGNTPPEWKQFTVKTLENSAPNTPLSYAPQLTERLKDAVQNNSRLQLSPTRDSSQIDIEGTITNYMVTPVALQEGDAAAKNRLTVSTNFTIYIKVPKEEQRTVSSTRFVDYDATQDLGTIEATLLQEINDQIVQDVINKLLSNW